MVTGLRTEGRMKRKKGVKKRIIGRAMSDP